jgi:hypothetical protein
MNEAVIANAYRGAVILLLAVIAVLEWQQTREIRLQANMQGYTAMNVRVINGKDEKIPIMGEVGIDTRNPYSSALNSDIPIPVRITNGSLLDPVPVTVVP